MGHSTAAAFRLLAVLLVSSAACSTSPARFSTFDESAAGWDAAVERAIPDAARAARLKALGRELTALQREMAADLAVLNEGAVALNGDYAATAEQARQVGRAYQEKRRVAFARYRDIVFAMRGVSSPSEWKALTK